MATSISATELTACAAGGTGPWRNVLSTLLASGRKVDAQDPAVVRQTGEKLAAELFFKPLLAELRRFPLGNEYGGGGPLESAFGDQLDQRLADQTAAAARTLTAQMLRLLRPAATGTAGTARAAGTQR